jgi:cytoskeletal protein RodZ
VGRLFKLGCAGVVVAVVGLVVIGLAMGGRQQTTVTGQPTAPSPAAAEKQAPAQPAAQKEAAPTTARVGQRIESAGVALTVNSVNRTDALGQFMKAKPDRTYVVADVTIEAAGRDKTPYNPLYFKVKDAEGYEYSGSAVGADNSLKSGELASGERARGTVAFDVPTAARGLVLSYQPVVILGGYQVLRVELE